MKIYINVVLQLYLLFECIVYEEREIRICKAKIPFYIPDAVTYTPHGDMTFYLYNDIALLTLATPVEVSDEVHPICLDFTPHGTFRGRRNAAPDVDFGVDDVCYATGWSLDEFDYDKWLRGDYSDVLNESKSKIAESDYCREHHSGFKDPVTLCTRYFKGTKDLLLL